jgi:hypothetical protein
VQEEEDAQGQGAVPQAGEEAAGVSAAVRRAATALLLAALVSLLAAPGASAATIVPVSVADVDNGSIDDPGCTLRDAVRAANANASDPNGCAGDNAGADTIVLEGGKTYTLSLHGVDDTNAKGDLDVTGPLTIRSSGPGVATIDAASNTLPGPPVGADRAIDVLEEAGTLTLEGIKVVGGFVESSAATLNGGGGIRSATSLTLRRSEVTGNRVEGTGEVGGGGILVSGSNGRLRLEGSTVAANTIIGTGPKPAAGGGIAVGATSPELTMVNSTVSDNTSSASGGNFGRSGGIQAGDVVSPLPVVSLTNVTITHNTGQFIGGITLRQGSVTASVIAGNTDQQVGTVRPDCYQEGSNLVTSGGANLIGDTGSNGVDCDFEAAGDLTGTHATPLSANLGTLVDNGGLTRTRAPNPGSPAIDRGGSCPETDQRGFFRAPVLPCDAGAVEAGATATLPEEPEEPSPEEPTPPAMSSGAGGPASPAPPAATKPGRTGKRARALARCKKKKTGKARRRCRAKARKLPR